MNIFSDIDQLSTGTTEQHEKHLEELREAERSAEAWYETMKLVDAGRGVYIGKVADAWLKYDNARRRRQLAEQER